MKFDFEDYFVFCKYLELRPCEWKSLFAFKKFIDTKKEPMNS